MWMIDEPERIELIQKLMNIPEQVHKSENPSDDQKVECEDEHEHLLLNRDCEKTELSPPTPESDTSGMITGLNPTQPVVEEKTEFSPDISESDFSDEGKPELGLAQLVEVKPQSLCLISDNCVRNVPNSGISLICDTVDDVTRENCKNLHIDDVVGWLDVSKSYRENLGTDNSDELETIKEIRISI